MSKIKASLKQDSENQRIIEEWMRRNNSGRIIIGPNSTPGGSSQNELKNEKKDLPIIVSVTKKDNESEAARRSSILSNTLPSIKRNITQPNVVQRKIARWSSPAVSIQIEPANKTLAPKFEEKNSCSNSKSSVVLKQVPKPTQPSKYLKSKLSVQTNLKKICAPTNRGIQNGKSNTINKKSIENRQLKDKQGVYGSIQDNYKYLLTPKHWSVTEFENDSNKECIVFSRPNVISVNEQLISVLQKSLVIDKGGTIHYSVYGLPVNVKGTILPDVLDNIKKLLSIVHIFDKMQVCKGLGDDLLIVKTDNLLKDVCQVWRHTDCKLLLVKADQCQICLDTRNILLEKEMLFKSELLSTEDMDVKIKQEIL